jgi:nucleotidyltransferase/DNA polymerase involved in DNA repair
MAGMAGPASLTSLSAACCWIPLFALRCEATRRPELADGPVALLTPDTTRRLWQVSPIARRAGVRPGMTVSQAIGLCAALRLVEPDPVHYDERFAGLVAALTDVSPAVEPDGERIFVGTDGLEGLYGGPEEQIREIQLRIADCGLRNRSGSVESAIANPRSAIRVGWGVGKFIAATAAKRARSDKPCIVRPGEEGRFLADQPVSVLPLDPDTHRRMRLLGIRTLGRLAALPEDAVTSQFGAAGRRLWRLAAGRTVEPVVGKLAPEPIRAALTLYAPLADRAMITRALGQLVDRALKHPRRAGWRVQALRASASLEQGASWVAAALLKDPTADRERLLAPLVLRL